MVEPTQSLGEIDLKNSTASELADADLASGTMNGDLLMQCSDGGPSSLLGAGPPSPLTGCYLMIVIGEPHSDEHKDIILQKLLKGFLSWDSSDCQVDLEEELNTITLHAPEGEEARHGERLIQYASENLVTEILIHPQYNTLIQCMRNLLSSFTRHRHIIHAGYTFAGNGSWILQDGTFSVSDFSEAFQENDVQRVLRAYPDTITMDIHCESVGLWSALPDKNFAKSCRIRINPNDVLNSGSDKINSFIDYAAPMIVPASLTDLLESSDVVGNIRFSHPTLYVFPGGQGDAALFGINGFNMLVDGGFGRKACFWDFTRHLDRLDAVLMTRISNCNINGLGAVVERKRGAHVYPQIGHFFCNVPERKGSLSPDGDKDNKDPLLIDLYDKGTHLVNNLRAQNLAPQTCFQDSEPINLYHKVGHGTLDMYVLSPSRDAKEVKEFLQKWNSNDSKLFQPKDTKEFVFPIQNLISICALLVWLPANPDDSITRILFPGSTPDYKIIEGLEKIKHLEFMKNPVCSSKSIAPSISSTTLSKKSIKSVTGGDKASDLIIPQRPMKSVERDNKTLDNKLKDEVVEKKKTVTKPRPSEPAKKVEKIDNKVTESQKVEEPVKEVVKDVDPMEEKEDKEKTIDESEAKTEIETKDEEEKDNGKEKVVEPEVIKEDIAKESSTEKDETDVIKSAVLQPAPSVPAPAKSKAVIEPKSAKKTESKPIKSRIDTRPPRSMAAQRQVTKKEEKKEIPKASPTTTPKKTAPQPKETKEIKSKVASRFSRSSPSSTPAKSAKDANNRKVLESKQKIAAAKKEPTPKPAEKKEPVAKPERKPISRRAKAESPSRRPQGSPVKTARPARTKAEKDKGKLEKGGTTDSSSVSTPSADDTAVVKKVIVPTLEAKPKAEPTADAPAIVDDLKEEQECVREIEAVFSRDQDKVVKKEVLPDRREVAETSKQDSTTEVEEDEEYLIIEKEEVEQYTEDSINEQESLTKEEEIQKHQRDSEESEKKRKSSEEEAQDEKPAAKEKAKVVEIIEGVDADKDVVSEKKDNEPEDDDMQPDSIEEDKIPNKEQIKEEVQEIITSAKEIAKTRTESRDELAIKTEEFSTPSIDEKISSNKRTSEETNDEKGEEQIAIERQQIVEQSQPDEKFSATAESGATTAPTLPEDERIPLDEIKEDLDIVEEKYAKEETKETETPIEAIQIKKQTAQAQYSMPPPPTYEPLERQQIPTQIKFDMQQSHLRDIVKTPDEVADLPVHEEVDYVAGYDDYHHPPTTAAPSVPSTGKSIDKKTDFDHDKKTDKDILKEVEDQIIPMEELAKKSEPAKAIETIPRFSECKDEKELADKVAEFDKIVPTKAEARPVHEEAKSVFTALKDEITESIATAIDLTKEKLEDKIEDIKTAKEEIKDDLVKTAETVKDQIKEEISKVVDEAEKIKDDLKKDVETTVDRVAEKIDDIKETVSEKKDKIVEDIAKTTEAVVDKGKEITEDIKKETIDILESTTEVKEKLTEETKMVEETVKAEVVIITEETKDIIETVKEEISIKTEDVRQTVIDKVDKISDDIKETVGDTKENIVDELIKINDEAKEKIDSIEDTVVELKDETIKEAVDIKDEAEEKLDEATEKAKYTKNALIDAKDAIIEDINDVKDVVEEKIEAKSAAVLESTVKIEKEVQDTIVDTKASIVESIIDIKEDISGKVSHIAEKISEKTKDVIDEATVEIKDTVKDIKDVVAADVKETKDSLAETTEKLVEDVKETKDEIKDKLLEDVNEIASTLSNEAEKIADDLKDDLKDEKDKLNIKTEETIKATSELETNLKGAVKGITDSILDFKDKLFNDVKETKDEIKADVSKITKDELIEDFKETKDDAKNKILDLTIKTSEEVKSEVSDLKEAVIESNDILVESTEDLVDKVIKDTTSSVAVTKEKILEDAKEIKDEVYDDIKTATQKIIDEAKEIEGTVESKATEIEEEMAEKKDELKEKMEDVYDLSAKLDDIKAKTAGFLDDLKLNASEAKHSFSDEASKFQDEIDDSKYEIKEEVLEKADSLKEQMTEKAAVLKAEAKDLKDKIEESTKDVVTDAKDVITSKLDGTKVTVTEMVSKVADGAEDVKDNIVEDIKTIGDNLGDETAEVQDKVEEQVSKVIDVKDEIIEDVKELKKEIVEIKEEVKEEIVEEIKAIKLETMVKVEKATEVKDEIISKVESTTEQVIDSAKEIKDEVIVKITKSADDLKTQVDDLLNDTQGKVSEASAKLEEAKDKVVEDTKDTTKKLSEVIDQSTDSIKDDVSEKIIDIKDEIKDIKDHVVEDTAKTVDAITDAKDKIVEDVTQVKDDVKDVIEDGTVKIANKIVSGIDSVKEDSKIAIDTLIDTKDIVADKLADTKEHIEDAKDKVAVEVDKVVDTASTNINEVKEQVATEASKVAAKVDTTIEDIKDEIDETIKTADIKIEDAKGKVATDVTNVIELAATKIEDAKETAEDKVSKVVDSVETKLDSTASKIEDTTEKITAEVSKTVDLVEVTVEDTTTKIEDTVKTVGDKVEDINEKAADEVSKAVDDFAGQIKDTKEIISDAVESKIEDTKETIDETIKKVGDKVEETKEKTAAEVTKVVDLAATKIEDTKKSAATELTKAADTIEESKEKILTEVAKTVETVTTKIEDTKEKAATEVAKATDTIEAKIDGTKDKMATALDSTASKIEDTKEKAATEVAKAAEAVDEKLKAAADKLDETKTKASNEIVKAIDKVDDVIKSTDIKIEETKEKVATEVAKAVDATSIKIEETKEKLTSEVSKLVEASSTKVDETKDKVATEVTKAIDSTSFKIEETKEKVATEVTKVVDATSTKIEETKGKIESKIDTTKDTVDKELNKAAETIEKSLDSAKEKIDSVKEEIQEKTKSGISSFFGGISQGIKSGLDKLTDKKEDKVKDAPKEEIELAKKPTPPTFEIKTFPTELRETHITTLDSPIKDQTERVAELKTLEKLPEQTEEEIEEMIKPSMTFQVEEIRYTSPAFDREDSSLNDIKEEEEEDHFSPPRKTSDSDKFSRSISPRTQEDVIKIVANVAEVLKSDKDLEEIIPDFDPEELEKKLSARASPVPLQQSSSPDEEADDDNVSKTVQRMLVTASSEDGGGEIEICPQGSIKFEGAVSGTATPDLRSGRHSPEELQTEEKSDQPKDTTIPTTFEDEFQQVADTKTDLSCESSTSIKSIPDESKADKTPQSSGKSTPELKTSPTSIDEKEKHELPEKMQKGEETPKTIPKITSTPPEKIESPVIAPEVEIRKESVVSENIDDAHDSRRESAISSVSEKDYTKEESSIGIDDKELSAHSHASDKSIEDIRDEVEKTPTKVLSLEKDEVDALFDKPGDTIDKSDVTKTETPLQYEIKTKEQVSQEIVSKEETFDIDMTDDGVDEVDKLKDAKIEAAVKTPEKSPSPIEPIKKDIGDSKLETLEFLKAETSSSRPDSAASQTSVKPESRPVSAASHVSEKTATDKIESRPESAASSIVHPKSPEQLSDDKKQSPTKSESSPESALSQITDISKIEPRPISVASHTSDLGLDKEQLSRPESRTSDKSRSPSVLSDHFDDEILAAMPATKAIMKETRSKSVASIMTGSMYKEHDDLKPLSALEEIHEYSKDDTDMLPKYLGSSKTSISSLNTEKIEKSPVKKSPEPTAAPKAIDMSKSVLDDIWGGTPAVPFTESAKPSSSKTSPSEHHETISLSGKSTPDIADVIEDKKSPENSKESVAQESGQKTPPTVPVSPNIKADIMTQSMIQMTTSTTVIEPEIHSGKSSPGLIQTSSESASKSTSVGQGSGVDTTDSSPKPTSPFPKGIQTIKDEVKTSSGMSTPDMTRMSTPDIMDTKYLDKSETGSDSVTTVTTTTITAKTIDSSESSKVGTEKTDKIETTVLSKTAITTTQPISKDVANLKTSEMRSFTPGMEDYDPHDVSSPRSDISSGQASRVIPGWTPGSSEERHVYSDDEVPSSPMSVTSHAAHSPPSKFAYEDPYDLQRSSSGVSKKSDLDIDDSQDDIPPQYGSEELKSAISISSSYRPDPMSTSFYGALPEMTTTGKSEPIPIVKSGLSAKSHLMEYTSSGPSEGSTTSSFSGTSKEIEITGGLPGGIDHKFLDEADLDFEKALEHHRQVRGADVMSSITSKYEYSPTRHVIDPTSDTSKVPELPKKGGEPAVVVPTTTQSSTSSSSSSLTQSSSQQSQSQSAPQPPQLTKDKEDFIASWGKPLGLPAPAPIPVENNTTPKKDTVMQQRRMVVNSKTKLNNEKNLRKRSESPVKGNNKKNSPIYMDLTYVPHHGNSYYSHVEFFKRVRARYYVFSGTEPSREVYNALLEAKQTWEDKDLEVTIIPTYDTDVLGYWVSENEDLLAKYHIDLSPSASRCTINLQDHETSCSAYRLEF